MARTARAFVLRPDPDGFQTVTTRLRDWLEAAGPDGAATYEHPYERRRAQATDIRGQRPHRRAARVHPLADAVAARPRVQPEARRDLGREVIDLVWCETRGVWRRAETPGIDGGAAAC